MDFARFGRDPDKGWLEQLGDMDRLLDQATADLERASAEMRYARTRISEENLDMRALTPVMRHDYVRMLQTEGAWQHATDVYNQVRAEHDRLLARYNEFRDTGLAGTSHGVTSLARSAGEYDDDLSIAAAERAVEQDRRNRLRD